VTRGRSSDERSAGLKTRSEYCVALGHRLILNLIDVDAAAYVSWELMDSALGFVHRAFSKGCRTLVHCNQGRSRGPAITLL
jgi:hypothetical protein